MGVWSILFILIPIIMVLIGAVTALRGEKEGEFYFKIFGIPILIDIVKNVLVLAIIGPDLSGYDSC